MGIGSSRSLGKIELRQINCVAMWGVFSWKIGLSDEGQHVKCFVFEFLVKITGVSQGK